MKCNLKRNFYGALVIAVALFLLAALSLSGDIEDTIEKSFNVKRGGKLILETDLGSITIKSQKAERVDVQVVREARTSSESRARDILADFDVDFRHSGSDVFIDADYNKSRTWSLFGKNSKLHVQFIVTVPEKYDLDIKTSGGSITVSEIEGEVEARTSGGSLKFEFVKGDVRGRTSGGSIRLQGCSGDADVKTSGGSIRIGKMSGEVRAHTSGGSIKVEEVMGIINASTSGGSVSATISQQPRANCSLKTSGGSVTVYLADDIAVDVDARTSGGRVHTDFPVSKEGEIKKNKLRGKINGGGHDLYLRTSGGSIYIKKID